MLEIIINEYKELLSDLDEQAAKTQKGLPMIPCPNKCYDCCKQIFQMSFLEAYYISKGFHSLERKKRRQLQKEAEKAFTKLPLISAKEFTHFNLNWEETMIKRAEFNNHLNEIESNCPFLKEETKSGQKEGQCSVYEYRNHDCRAHGYSFDKASKEIIACFRFAKLFPTPEPFMEKAFEYNYRYTDKLKLDRKLIVHLTENPNFKNILYLTHPFIPILKDFESINWQDWFTKKFQFETEPNKYSLLIDCEIT